MFKGLVIRYILEYWTAPHFLFFFFFALKEELKGGRILYIIWSIYKAREQSQNGAKMHFTDSAVLPGRTLYIEMMAKPALLLTEGGKHWGREVTASQDIQEVWEQAVI